MPPMYNYSFTPLQRSYSLNIPGRTRDFTITVWVRYSSERPTTPGGPLHPGRRRPRGLLTTPYHNAGVARSSPVFAFRPEEQRRRATSALAPGIGFSVLGVLSSPSDLKTSEDGPPPCLLLASASESLTSYLRAPSATGPKVVSPTHAYLPLRLLSLHYLTCFLPLAFLNMCIHFKYLNLFKKFANRSS